MATKLELAFVGCGSIAEAHWRGIQSVADRISVTAVVETDEERRADMARRTGAEPFASLEAALAGGRFAAVDIMLPHDLHEEAALACFAVGKHVLLEKPLAHTLASAERILEAAARLNNHVFMIAEQSQYWTDIIKARELIDAGAIGRVVNARAFYQERRPLPDPAAPPWRCSLDRAGGGLVIDGGAHWIRPLRMMLGEVDEVIAVTGRHVPGMEGESWSQSILRFQSGVTAVFDAKLSAGRFGPTEHFRVTGEVGELLITLGSGGGLRLFNADFPEGETILDPAGLQKDSIGLELRDFSEAVLDGVPPAATADRALGEMRTALAIYASGASGCWEKVWTPK